MKMGFEVLPVEIALKIFGLLPACELAKCCTVSKRWNILASSDELWMKLIETDGFQDEVLVPLKGKDLNSLGDVGKGEKKAMYARRVRALARWKSGDWKNKAELNNVEGLSPLGNGSLLAILFRNSTLGLYDLEESKVVQTLSLPSPPKEGGWIGVLGNGKKLVVSSEMAALVFSLDGCLLRFRLAISYSKGSEGRPEFMLASQIPDKLPQLLNSTPSYEIKVAELSESILSLICYKSRRKSAVIIYFCLKTGKEIRQDTLDGLLYYSLYKDYIFKECKGKLLCQECLSGKTVLEAKTSRSREPDEIMANDSVIVRMSGPPGSLVVETWDWSGSSLGRTRVGFCCGYATHPTAPALFVIYFHKISLVEFNKSAQIVASWSLPFDLKGLGEFRDCTPFAFPRYNSSILASTPLTLFRFSHVIVLIDPKSHEPRIMVRKPDGAGLIDASSKYSYSFWANGKMSLVNYVA